MKALSNVKCGILSAKLEHQYAILAFTGSL